MTRAATAPTEAEMLDLLRQRYTEKAGNGDAYAFMTHVRDRAGFDARRTADAVVMSLWQSRGLELMGFEVKVSRSDWLRELKQPAKAEAFCTILDRWYVVAGDKDIVREGELPATWGLLVKQGGKLVCKREAPALRDLTEKPPVSREFLVCLLKAPGAKAGADPAAIVEAREAGRAEGRRIAETDVELLTAQVERLEAERREFQQASGVPLGWYRSQNGGAEAVGKALRMVLEGSDAADGLENRLRLLREQADAISAAATQVMEGRIVQDSHATPDNGYDGPQPPDDFGEDIEATVTQFAGEPQATPDPLRVRSVILSESAATNPERILLSIRRARKLLGVADAHVEIVVRAYTGGE